MNTDTLSQQFTETFSSLFQRGSRYQTEKLLTLGGFIACSLASLAWAFSGDGGENQLGATFRRTEVEELGRDVYSLRNESDEDWTQVRMVIDRRYLYKREVLKARGAASLSQKDFAYFYYIPRAWGLNDWEQLARSPKPPQNAPNSLTPQLVQLRARQGKLDIDLSKTPSPP